MAQISNEDVERVREATDLVALVGERTQIRQKGRDFWCCCPFHQEKTPSCKIDGATGRWHCFGCGEGGDAFSFLMKLDSLSFPEAVRALAERAHIEIKETSGGRPAVSRDRKGRLQEVCKATADFYHRQLLCLKGAEADAARSYLGGRGLGGEVAKRWQLGFAPGHGVLVRHLGSLGFTPQEMVQANVALQRDGGPLRDRFFNRAMFPIFDERGSAIAFGGRVIGQGEPKYLNSQETPLFHKSKVLFGLDKAKAAMASTGVAIVTEGYTDVIALHEAGIRNAVATLGTALTLSHIRLLSRHASKRIVYLFDGDEAGKRAADRALGFIDESMTPEAGRSQVELCAVTLPDNLDPADFVAQRGADALRELIDQAVPLIQYGIDRRLARHDLSTAEGRSAALADALSVLAPIKGSFLAKDYAVQLAGRTRASEADVLARLAALKAPRRTVTADEEALGFAAAGPSVPPPAPAAPRPRRLSAAERSRLSFEREFLRQLSTNPQAALDRSDALASTRWHDGAHRDVASAMLEVLAEQPSLSPSRFAAAVVERAPVADRVLAGGVGGSEATDFAERSYLDTLQFVADELSIGDLRDELQGIRASLAAPTGVTDEERAVFLQMASVLQSQLVERQSAHGRA